LHDTSTYWVLLAATAMTHGGPSLGILSTLGATRECRTSWSQGAGKRPATLDAWSGCALGQQVQLGRVVRALHLQILQAPRQGVDLVLQGLDFSLRTEKFEK